MWQKIRLSSIIFVNILLVLLFYQCGSVFYESIGGDGLGLLMNFVVVLPGLLVFSIARFFLRVPPYFSYWWLDIMHGIVLLMLAITTASASLSNGIILATIGALLSVFDTIHSIIIIVRQKVIE